jgi:phosphoribosylcarboxyaminoimidazole (NCAIR) mutase
MAIGKAGARNAGIFAAQILSVENAGVAKALQEQRFKMAAGVEAKSDALQEKLKKDGFAE